jgi:hypothetical protein
VMERATKEELAIVLEVMSETLKEKDPEAWEKISKNIKDENISYLWKMGGNNK